MRIWLAFWAASMNRPELRRLQRANDKRLHSNLAWHFARVMPRDRARTVATGLAALIDGLWLRGSLASDVFDAGEARALACAYVDQHLLNG
jgi:TetR/AcrR family transcriptional regulator, transcriptional repressor of bet genes